MSFLTLLQFIRKAEEGRPDSLTLPLPFSPYLSKAKRKLDLEGLGRPTVPEFRTPKGKCVRVDGLPSPKSKSFRWAPTVGWHEAGVPTQVTSPEVYQTSFLFQGFLCILTLDSVQ